MDRAIATTGDEIPAVATKGQGPDSAVVLQRLTVRKCALDVPKLNRVVDAATSEQPSIWTDSEGHDATAMYNGQNEALFGLSSPDFIYLTLDDRRKVQIAPESNRIFAAGNGTDIGSRCRGNSYGSDDLILHQRRLDLRPIVQVPQASSAAVHVAAAGKNHLAIASNCQAANPVSMVHDYGTLLSRLGIPHSQHCITASSQQLLAFGRKRQRP